MATNLWPNQWCEASGPVIGSVAADVDAPEHGGVFTLAGRGHTAGPRVPLAAGEQYLIQFVARRVSGALALNAGVWLTQKSTSSPWQMGSCTKVADLPIGGGWALYERVQRVPADGTEGQLYFQIDQGLANGDPNGTHVWQVAGPLMWKRVADMAVKARDDVTLATLTDVANVRRYYLLQSSTLNPPAAPTANPAPAPWVTAEPTYTEGSTTSLYTVDLTVFTDGTFDYSAVSKSSSYEAAKSAFNKAVSATNVANAALAAVPPFVQQATPSATVVGQLWFPLDASGRMIGMKRASKTGTSGWVDYLWMAGKILVPGSVGTTEIGPDGVLAANIKASNELWAKLATFAKITTDMLTAGNAVITGELLADVITGIILRGGLFEAGGGSLPMIRVGPLSGQIGTGDSYGVQITTPNSNANGSATLGISPTGPYLDFYDGAGNQSLYADKTGIKVPNRYGGGMVDISMLMTNTLSWAMPTRDISVQFSANSGSMWGVPRYFRTPRASKPIYSVGKVSSPTGRLLVYSGVSISAPDTDQLGLEVQWQMLKVDPSGKGETDTGSDTQGFSFAEARSDVGGTGLTMVGMELVSIPANTEFWLVPKYWQYNLSDTPVRRDLTRLWVYVTPAP